MEAILFSGIQAAGKSSFFKAHFADSHVRINLDMLRTRHREQALMTVCLETRQAFVVDNTNLSIDERARYIALARAAGFRLVAYRFFVSLETAIERNAARQARRPVPEKALRAAARRWQPPQMVEGFDAIYDIQACEGEFRMRPIDRPWQANEILMPVAHPQVDSTGALHGVGEAIGGAAASCCGSESPMGHQLAFDAVKA